MMRIFHVTCATDDNRLRAYEISAPAGASKAQLLALARQDENIVRLTKVESVTRLPDRPTVLRQLSYIP